MVSWNGHVLPVLVTLAVWFLATGLVAWLDNRERRTFPRVLVIASLAGLAGLGLIVQGMGTVSVSATYLGFAGALLVWCWHEIGFLTGAVAGPRREPCPEGATGWERFAQAASTLLHHELALALTLVMLIALTWDAPNQLGAMTFALLWVMRLSAKLNIFAGVPNSGTDILPPHLYYLKSYYGPNRLAWPLFVSLAGGLALTVWLGSIALAAPAASAQSTGASLLFALAALGVIEHLFLALPFRDGALWGWALPRLDRSIIAQEES